MRQRGVRPRGADGVERQVAQNVARIAKFAQLGGGRKLIEPALGPLDAEPVEIACNRRAVAGLRIALALLLDRVLDRARQDRGVPHRNRLGVRAFQRVEDRRHAIAGIDRHGLALQFGQRRLERRARPDRHRVAEMLGQLRGNLVFADEQFGGAVGMSDDIRQRDRRALDVGPADVEQPGYRIERADHCGVVTFGLEPVGHLGALVGARAARVRIVVDDCRRVRGLGAVGPHRVDRVAVNGHQAGVFLLQRLGHTLGPAL